MFFGTQCMYKPVSCLHHLLPPLVILLIFLGYVPALHTSS